MAAARPDLTVWLGDNLYFREVDFDSPWGMAARYAHSRQQSSLQALLRTGSHAAIWDDHDFGPNDSNSSFNLKDASLELFKRYWPNPSFGLPEHPGVFTIARQGDADFFLLDGRWYRDADLDSGSAKVMFGATQMRWLKNALLNSTANFKIIASGSPMLDGPTPYESWSHFNDERQGFIDWLTANKVNGVMFLSGDRHHTEMLQWPRSGTYPLHELICSPLTAGPRDISKGPATPGQIPGTLVGERNFCTLDFSGPRTKRTLVIRAVATDGRELWQQSLSASAMRTPKP
jgi:alkaline phosphatase D